MNFLRLPIERPVTTVMLFVGVALMGIISWTRIPQELFPSLEYPQITVVTKYEGAGPEESEKLLSKIIEETVGTVKGVKRVSSISKEGISIVTCEFRWGTSMDFASMEVREKIDLIKESLPKDSNDPIVLKYNPMQVEAMIISTTYLKKDSNPWKLAELRQFCKKNLKDEIERLDGVAKIEIRGGETKEILVEIDKGRLIANQVSINEIISSLRDSNITYPAGTIKEENLEYLVKTVGEFQNISDIEALSFSKKDQSGGNRRVTRRVRGENTYRDDKIIYLRDIADIKESLKDRTGYSRYNSNENVSLAVYPQSGSNLIKMADGVRKKLEEIKTKYPSDIDIKVIYDQSEFIKASLNNIYSSALWGGLLSFIILYFFMKSFVASIIINIAIPVTMLSTLTMMYFGNISINTMSLGGLTIGIGMVVDSSNIVFENILLRFHRNPEKAKKEIIFESASELVAPIVSSTLTSVAIFLPFIFVTGMAGQLFKQLALTITFSMISSVFVAIFLVPRLALNVDLSKQSVETGKKATKKYFVPMLKKTLNWPAKKMLLLFLAYALTGVSLYFFIPKEFMPKVDERRFVLNISLSPEATLDATNSVTKRIETFLSNYQEIKDLSVTVGATSDDSGVGAVQSLGSYQSRIIARLNKKGLRTHTIVTELSDEIDKWNISGLETEFITQQGLFGSQVGATSGVTIEVKGKDLDKLRAFSVILKKEIASIPELYGIKISPSDLVPELKVQIDRERASLFGLSTQDIAAMALAAIKGFVATKLKLKDEEFDIRVRLRASDRDSLEKITEMTAYSQWGMTIQLKQISEPIFIQSLPEIKRFEGERTYLVTANIEGNFSRTVEKIRQLLADLPVRDDISTAITGEMLAMKESMKSSVFAMILGVLIIYMILSSQFESLKQPIIVMTAVPLGLLGAIITLFITFKSINSISMLGMIMMIGTVVNISILLVDRYNNKLSKEKVTNIAEMKNIVVGCTSDHIRPILMTTLTTVLVLFPLALGIGEGAEATAPMAITVIGGLSFALILTIFFVPYVYIFSMRNSIATAEKNAQELKKFY